MMTKSCEIGIDRWMVDQMFEEDVRAVLRMFNPNRRERLMGWSEYRTGGSHFRATVSWDEHFEFGSDRELAVPRLAEVLEALLIGSVKSDHDLPAEQEFAVYREVIEELSRRLEDARACYE